MVVDNRGILPASYSISSVRHALRASAGVRDIVVPCRWSDSPLPLPLVRRPIGPKYHWSDGDGPLPLALVRKPIALVRRLIAIGPKKCHCHAISYGIGPKTIGIGPKKCVIGLKTHWSEKVSLV